MAVSGQVLTNAALNTGIFCELYLWPVRMIVERAGRAQGDTGQAQRAFIRINFNRTVRGAHWQRNRRLDLIRHRANRDPRNVAAATNQQHRFADTSGIVASPTQFVSFDNPDSTGRLMGTADHDLVSSTSEATA